MTAPYFAAALTLAQLAASIARADEGGSPARIEIYTTARPAGGASAGGAAQIVFELQKPCAEIAGGVMSWLTATPSTLVLANGIPRWGRWIAGDGVVLMDADATDPDHGGFFQIAGGTTAGGETSPTLYAGGLVILGAVALT